MKTLSTKCVDGIKVHLDSGETTLGPGESVEILAPEIIADLAGAGLVDDSEAEGEATEEATP